MFNSIRISAYTTIVAYKRSGGQLRLVTRDGSWAGLCAGLGLVAPQRSGPDQPRALLMRLLRARHHYNGDLHQDWDRIASW